MKSTKEKAIEFLKEHNLLWDGDVGYITAIDIALKTQAREIFEDIELEIAFEWHDEQTYNEIKNKYLRGDKD